MYSDITISMLCCSSLENTVNQSSVLKKQTIHNCRTFPEQGICGTNQ